MNDCKFCGAKQLDPSGCQSMDVCNVCQQSSKRPENRSESEPEFVASVIDSVEETKRPKSSEKSSNDDEAYSKRFLRKKNELQTKMSKNRPERELCQLKHQIGFEINKLQELVRYALEYAIQEQRQSQLEKSGLIPVSTVGKKKARKESSQGQDKLDIENQAESCQSMDVCESCKPLNGKLLKSHFKNGSRLTNL